MHTQDSSPDHLGIREKNSLKIWLNKLSQNDDSGFLNSLLKKSLVLPRKLVRIKRKRDTEKFYFKHKKDIDTILDFAQDDISKEVIRTQLAFIKDYDYTDETTYLKKNNLFEKHTHLLNTDEYFPEGIINLTNNECFVDGGGFNGDTVREFIKRSSGNFDHIFSFEPDKKNFIDLVTEVKKLNLTQDKATCYPYGLYSENKKVHFDQRGIGSSITEEGEDIIEVVRLDTLLNQEQKNKISFIKLDVEGSELEALTGMQEIIKNNRPKLAICVYHKTEHFWEVPFLIKSLNPEYKIYFRQHALSRLETVCYAV
jgi:FkbM family methyltransferase